MHTRPVPRLGGVAVALSMLVSLMAVVAIADGFLGVSAAQLRFTFGTLLAATLLCVVGFADDLRDLRPAWKLTAQVVAALIVRVRAEIGVPFETLQEAALAYSKKSEELFGKTKSLKTLTKAFEEVKAVEEVS